MNEAGGMALFVKKKGSYFEKIEPSYRRKIDFTGWFLWVLKTITITFFQSLTHVAT
jgi:hypothetical protein